MGRCALPRVRHQLVEWRRARRRSIQPSCRADVALVGDGRSVSLRRGNDGHSDARRKADPREGRCQSLIGHSFFIADAGTVLEAIAELAAIHASCAVHHAQYDWLRGALGQCSPKLRAFGTPNQEEEGRKDLVTGSGSSIRRTVYEPSIATTQAHPRRTVFPAIGQSTIPRTSTHRYAATRVVLALASSSFRCGGHIAQQRHGRFVRRSRVFRNCILQQQDLRLERR